MTFSSHSPEWATRVERWAKCIIIGLTDCDTAFCTKLSIDKCLTKSPFLSKLKVDPGIPTVSWFLTKYASGPPTLMNFWRVRNWIWVYFAVLLGTLLLLFRLRIAMAIIAISSFMSKFIRPFCKKSKTRRLPNVWQLRFGFCKSSTVWDAVAIFRIYCWHPSVEDSLKSMRAG